MRCSSTSSSHCLLLLLDFMGHQGFGYAKQTSEQGLRLLWHQIYCARRRVNCIVDVESESHNPKIILYRRLQELSTVSKYHSRECAGSLPVHKLVNREASMLHR